MKWPPWRKRLAAAGPSSKTPESPSGEPNPYLDARRTWDSRLAELAYGRQFAQYMALLAALVALAAVGGQAYTASQVKFVPYVVEVNRLGEASAVRMADRASPLDHRIVRATLATFITDARLVTPDAALQRRAILRAYAFVGPSDPASVKLDEWYGRTEEASPFRRATREVVTVDITSVMPQSAETWQADWTESVRDRQGNLKSQTRWRALLTVYQSPPGEGVSEEQLMANPLGLFLRDFSWSRQG